MYQPIRWVIAAIIYPTHKLKFFELRSKTMKISARGGE